MTRGPIPDDDAVRHATHPPTIPSKSLPMGGFQGEIPESPYVLADAGQRWWLWAWRTPQASAWDPGSLYALGRRAMLEDELAALNAAPEIEIGDMFADVLAADGDRKELRKVTDALDWLVTALQRRAGGIKAISSEMRELDKRFGLDPKAVAENRWKFAADSSSASSTAAASPAASSAGSAKSRFAVVNGGA